MRGMQSEPISALNNPIIDQTGPLMSPSISVIVTAYQRTSYIAQALESIAAQTLKPLEVIVADDSNNAEIKKQAFDAGLQSLIYRGNPIRSGVAASIARALTQCRGQFVSILNDDDVWQPTFLERLCQPLTHDDRVVLAFSDH